MPGAAGHLPFRKGGAARPPWAEKQTGHKEEDPCALFVKRRKNKKTYGKRERRSAHDGADGDQRAGGTERDQAAGLLLPIHPELPDAVLHTVGVFHLDLIPGAPIQTGEAEALYVRGDAGVDLQPVQAGLHAEDGLGNAQEGPGGGAGEPAVFALAEAGSVPAGDHLAVDIGLSAVDVADVLDIGGGGAAVDLKGPVAVAKLRLGADDPVDGFMIQGGDPLGTGMGGSSTHITGEFAGNGWDNPISHQPGVISMARSGDPNSASSQFFICVGDASFLDGSYAAFGWTADEESLEIALQIAKDAKPVDNNGSIPKGEQPVIESVKVVD